MTKKQRERNEAVQRLAYAVEQRLNNTICKLDKRLRVKVIRPKLANDLGPASFIYLSLEITLHNKLLATSTIAPTLNECTSRHVSVHVVAAMQPILKAYGDRLDNLHDLSTERAKQIVTILDRKHY